MENRTNWNCQWDHWRRKKKMLTNVTMSTKSAHVRYVWNIWKCSGMNLIYVTFGFLTAMQRIIVDCSVISYYIVLTEHQVIFSCVVFLIGFMCIQHLTSLFLLGWIWKWLLYEYKRPLYNYFVNCWWVRNSEFIRL